MQHCIIWDEEILNAETSAPVGHIDEQLLSNKVVKSVKCHDFLQFLGHIVKIFSHNFVSEFIICRNIIRETKIYERFYQLDIHAELEVDRLIDFRCDNLGGNQFSRALDDLFGILIVRTKKNVYGWRMQRRESRMLDAGRDDLGPTGRRYARHVDNRWLDDGQK